MIDFRKKKDFKEPNNNASERIYTLFLSKRLLANVIHSFKFKFLISKFLFFFFIFLFRYEIYLRTLPEGKGFL